MAQHSEDWGGWDPNGANPWGAVKSGGVAGHDPSSETEDGISMDAHWIWTSDGAGHDDIYCISVRTEVVVSHFEGTSSISHHNRKYWRFI